MNIKIYFKDNKFYLLENGVYVQQIVEPKRYTIAISPMFDGERLTELKGATEYTFKELKDLILKEV